ncbi:MFS transporter [Rhodotorula paludigena]|uniref:MFS transporter n=1 Tax=Rhodotorula paludigena TaxID=86838 RepID=UPI00316DF5CE
MPPDPPSLAHPPVASSSVVDVPALPTAPSSPGNIPHADAALDPEATLVSGTPSEDPAWRGDGHVTPPAPQHNRSNCGRSEDDELPVVRRAVTSGMLATPPYTIHSQRMRWFIVIMVALAGLFSPLSANIYFPVIPSIADDLSTTVEDINISVTVYMIFQGISPSFMGAICDVLGRRPVYILTFIIYLGACAGLANTHSYALLLVLRCIQAAGSASVIAIGSGSIGDIAPPAERGMFMALFGLGPMVGPCIGPVVGGVLADHFGWQSLFWFLFAFGAVVLVFLVLFLPETLRSLVGNGSIPARGINRSGVSIWHEHQQRKRQGPRDEEAEAASLAAKPPQKGWKDVRPFAPLKMFREKDVVCVLVFNAVTYTLFYTVTTSTGSVFKDTYGLNETELGLCFLANGVGCLLATFTGGPRMTADYKHVRQQVERKKLAEGISLEEQKRQQKGQDQNDLSAFPIEKARLRSMPYFFFLLVAATIVYGWVVDRGVHISVPLIMQFIIGLSVTSVFNIVGTLLVDLYPGQSASATAANNLIRCCFGAAGTGFIEPLLNRLGAGWSFTMLTLINCLFIPLMLLEWRYGMKWRAERAARLKAAKDRAEERAREQGRVLEKKREGKTAA